MLRIGAFFPKTQRISVADGIWRPVDGLFHLSAVWQNAIATTSRRATRHMPIR